MPDTRTSPQDLLEDQLADIPRRPGQEDRLAEEKLLDVAQLLGRHLWRVRSHFQALTFSWSKFTVVSSQRRFSVNNKVNRLTQSTAGVQGARHE